MKRDRAMVCDDLNNIGDLLLALQNLHCDGPGTIVRRWGPVPADSEEQIRSSGGSIVPGHNILLFAFRCVGRDLVIGGGQLVRDNTGLRSLFGALLAGLAVRLSGGQVMTRGLGVGKLRSRSRRILWRLILQLAAQVNVRDQVSQQNAQTFISEKRIVRTADMAFLETPTKHRLFDEERACVTRSGIVLAPCIDTSEGRNFAGPAINALLLAAEARGLTSAVSIARHDPRPNMDTAAGDILIDRFPTLPVTMPASHTLSSVAELYMRSEIVVTNRLHAVIMAALAGTAVIALDTPDGKISMYADLLNIVLLSPDTEMTQAEAHAALTTALSFDRRGRESAILRLEQEAARNIYP